LISNSGFTDKADFEENPDEGLNLGFDFGVGWTFQFPAKQQKKTFPPVVSMIAPATMLQATKVDSASVKHSATTCTAPKTRVQGNNSH
jgi:hypothetical protein